MRIRKKRVSPEKPLQCQMNHLDQPLYIQFSIQHSIQPIKSQSQSNSFISDPILNQTTNTNSYLLNNIPKIENTDLMLDIVRYALLNTKRKPFMSMLRRKIVQSDDIKPSIPQLEVLFII